MQTVINEDWRVVLSMFPEGWREQAKTTGALVRCRNFDGPESLLRVLMIHLTDGCSLRETAVRAEQSGFARVTDVALLKRLRSCGEWFRWIAQGLMAQCVRTRPEELFGQMKVRLVDGSIVNEPGATGSTWRVHYSFSLSSLSCDEVYVTAPNIGESFKRFAVTTGDLLVGDRGYAHREGIAHVLGAGGHVLVRANLTNVPLEDELGNRFPLLHHLRGLKHAQLGDWTIWIKASASKGAERMPLRICAIKKSSQATEKAQQKLLQGLNKAHKTNPDTIESVGYIFVLTSLPREQYPPSAVLEMYRGRWQIELAFKRLKSLLRIGHLKKTDIEGASAWLQGKLMVAFLIENLIAAGECISPWGYPIAKSSEVLLEGNISYAPTS